MGKGVKKLEYVLCLGFVFFQMYTSVFGSIPGIAQKSLHLAFLFAILFIGLYQTDCSRLLKAADIFFLIGGSIVMVYITSLSKTLAVDTSTHTLLMSIFGIMFILLLLFACWRKVGWVLTLVISFFIFYAFFGRYFPFLFKHGGMKASRFLHMICYTSEGIFGSPLNSSSTFIAMFIILGSLFSVTGVGDYITELASSVFGIYRGGPAKVAVVGSALFGSISGSACANVIGTGTFTIPLMKKIGYDSEFAGAVEAVASTGGSLMPPIMGSTAFLMAELIGVRYWDIVKAAIIPALLFYATILISVDLYASKNHLLGLKRSELPKVKQALKGIWKLSPMIALVIFIGPMAVTITRAGVYTFIYTLLISFLSKDTRLTKKKLVDFVYAAGRGCVTVAVACASVGIIIGTITGTGLSYRMSSILVELSGGNIVVLLIITMISSLIFGMGLPTSACYLVLAALVVPAMITMEIPVIAAHMFVFYFGIISNVTPPVAMAAYAASGIANCNPSQCGMKAFKLATAGFILPYMFVFNHVLLFDGTKGEILLAFAGAIIGVYCLACSLQAYIWNAPINFLSRIILFGAAVCLIDSALLTDLIGIGLMAAVHLYWNLKCKKETQKYGIDGKQIEEGLGI